MRQLQLPFYHPLFPAPERAVLTLLHAALQVAEQALHDEHPSIDAQVTAEHHGAPVVVTTARLIAGRCVELRHILDAYDLAVDEYIGTTDDDIPF